MDIKFANAVAAAQMAKDHLLPGHTPPDSDGPSPVSVHDKEAKPTTTPVVKSTFLVVPQQDPHALLLPLDLIDIESQIRERYDEEHLQQLAEDIKLRGLRQAICVSQKSDGRYRLETGEHRYRAFGWLNQQDPQNLNYQKIRVMLVEPVGNVDRMLDQFQENVQRKDFSPLEEARSIRFFQTHYGISGTREIARRLNISKNRVSRRLALLDPLPEQSKKIVDARSSVKTQKGSKSRPKKKAMTLPFAMVESVVSLLVTLAQQQGVTPIGLSPAPTQKELLTTLRLRLSDIKSAVERSRGTN